MAGSAPPNGAFEVHVTSRVTVAAIANFPPPLPAEERRYVWRQSVPSSGAPAVQGVPGPEHATVLPSPSFQETETGRAVTVDHTRPLLAVAV